MNGKRSKRSDLEIGVHALRKYIKNQWSEDRIVVKIDTKNVFNYLRRDLMTKVKEHLPTLFEMI